jgi:hypothetical protein
MIIDIASQLLYTKRKSRTHLWSMVKLSICAMQSPRSERRLALLILDLGTRVSGQRYTPAELYPRYPFDRRLGGPQIRFGYSG